MSTAMASAGADRAAIRVMIVDDSITARTVFSRLIAKEGDLKVVAMAGTAESALSLLGQMRVDVIMLDLQMPGMGGLKALPQLIAEGQGARILVVSSLTAQGTEESVEALALGAADTVQKPVSGQFDLAYRSDLIARIRELGESAQRPHFRPKPAASLTLKLVKRSAQRPAVLAIGASTGGIHAIGALFRALPERIGVPIFITQHLPQSFMPVFVRQLEAMSRREVMLASEGMTVRPDQVIVAPGDGHIVAHGSGTDIRLRIERKRSPSGCLPSVDPMFASLARTLGPRVLGVVLTGMGRDGSSGAEEIVRAGGSVLVQDEASSAVWGMPKAIAEAGNAAAILPPDQIAQRIAASLAGAP